MKLILIKIDFRRKSKIPKFDNELNNELDNEKNLTPIIISKPKRDDPTYYYDIELHNDIKINETVHDEQKYYEVVGDNFDENNLNKIKSINNSRLKNVTNTHLYEKLKKNDLKESVYTKLHSKIQNSF
jgi:hypothetical protein